MDETMHSYQKKSSIESESYKMDLKEENKRLREKLAHAQSWMQKEVSQRDKHANISAIEENIYTFFPAEVFSHFPTDWVENIISSELVYRHILAGETLDGMGVILGYQKVTDEMIELYITKWFRKFIEKNWHISSPVNTPLEKSLHMVITKKHILSLWRIYAVGKTIQSQEKLTPYLSLFWEYLKSRPFLHKCLLESDFLLQLESLIHMQAITDKRHSGTLSKEDTLKAREIFIWDFTNENCLLYILAHSQSTEV